MARIQANDRVVLARRPSADTGHLVGRHGTVYKTMDRGRGLTKSARVTLDEPWDDGQGQTRRLVCLVTHLVLEDEWKLVLALKGVT